MRYGTRTCRSTATATAASGGATIAPRATAADHGMSGTSARLTTETAAVVTPTAKTTSAVTAAQSYLRSRMDVSYAASSNTGARKSARARSAGIVNDGVPGKKARTAPPMARKIGYGA